MSIKEEIENITVTAMIQLELRKANIKLDGLEGALIDSTGKKILVAHRKGVISGLKLALNVLGAD